jgi:1-acyl-sn-glycerol-3-phosphate acyltransferase
MNWFRIAMLTLVAKPLARVFTGVDVVNRERLPTRGPAIVAANHASHVDTLLLLTIFPARTIGRVRPAAAADYFLKGPVIGWFSQKIIGIVPVQRTKAGSGEDVLAPLREALAAGDIVVIFPEGTRGDGEAMAQLKSGVARLAEAFPEAPVVPAWLQGAGRVLPKGASIPVPMNCTVLVGEGVNWTGDKTLFMDTLRDRLEGLHAQAPPQRWA